MALRHRQGASAPSASSVPSSPSTTGEEESLLSSGSRHSDTHRATTRWQNEGEEFKKGVAQAKARTKSEKRALQASASPSTSLDLSYSFNTPFVRADIACFTETQEEARARKTQSYFDAVSIASIGISVIAWLVHTLESATHLLLGYIGVPILVVPIMGLVKFFSNKRTKDKIERECNALKRQVFDTIMFIATQTEDTAVIRDAKVAIPGAKYQLDITKITKTFARIGYDGNKFFQLINARDSTSSITQIIPKLKSFRDSRFYPRFLAGEDIDNIWQNGGKQQAAAGQIQDQVMPKSVDTEIAHVVEQIFLRCRLDEPVAPEPIASQSRSVRLWAGLKNLGSALFFYGRRGYVVPVNTWGLFSLISLCCESTPFYALSGFASFCGPFAPLAFFGIAVILLTAAYIYVKATNPRFVQEVQRQSITVEMQSLQHVLTYDSMDIAKANNQTLVQVAEAKADLTRRLTEAEAKIASLQARLGDIPIATDDAKVSAGEGVAYASMATSTTFHHSAGGTPTHADIDHDAAATHRPNPMSDSPTPLAATLAS